MVAPIGWEIKIYIYRIWGFAAMNTYPATARPEFGDRRIGEVHSAADIEVGIDGRRSSFVAFVLKADIPAVLCRRAREALGCQLDFAQNALTLRKHGVDIPLRVNEMGHCVSAVAS